MGTWLNSLHIHSIERKRVRSVAEKLAREQGARFRLGAVRKGWIALLVEFTSMPAELGESFAAECPAPIFHVSVADDDDFQLAGNAPSI